MGQSESSLRRTIVVHIYHKHASSPPSGWTPYGSIDFHVHADETVGALIRNINEYRSPKSKIIALRDVTGNYVSNDETIGDGDGLYYV